MSAEREAVIWCPACREDRFEILRIPTGEQGVVEHKTNPANLTPAQRKFCVCGAVLERK